MTFSPSPNLTMSEAGEAAVPLSEELEVIGPGYDLDPALEEVIAAYMDPVPKSEVTVSLDTNPESMDVTYSVRGPRDVVLSGPLINGWGPGPWHATRAQARKRLVAKFGEARVQDVPFQAGRWAYLVKNLKAE